MNTVDLIDQAQARYKFVVSHVGACQSGRVALSQYLVAGSPRSLARSLAAVSIWKEEMR